MKAKVLISMLILFVSVLSCNRDCEEGYVRNFGPDGTSFCMPEFEEGKLYNFKLGNTYYHKKYGVITLKEGFWLNAADDIIAL